MEKLYLLYPPWRGDVHLRPSYQWNGFRSQTHTYTYTYMYIYIFLNTNTYIRIGIYVLFALRNKAMQYCRNSEPIYSYYRWFLEIAVPIMQLSFYTISYSGAENNSVGNQNCWTFNDFICSDLCSVL